MPIPMEKDGRRTRVDFLAPELEVCSRQAIECLFNLPTLLLKTIPPQTSPEPNVRVHITAGNPEFSVVISLEAGISAFLGLLPPDSDRELAEDAIGEIVNVLAGSLFGSPEFRSTFGCMRASVPLKGPDAPSFGPRSKLRCVLLAGSTALVFEMSVKSNNPTEKT